MKISLNKGDSLLDLQIPDEKVYSVISGNDVPAIPHQQIMKIIEEGIMEYLPHDIAGKKTTVIIPDDTRAWARGELFVPCIVKTLEKMGVSDNNITIIIAQGTHADIPSQHFAQLCGEYCAGHINILNAANADSNRLSFIGRTSRNTEVYITREAVQSDHIIIFGGVLHHMAAGYGGGRKYILPGIAGYDSIQQNHSLTIRDDGSPHPMVRQGILTGNPVSEDMDEAARLFLENRTCTYVAVAANGSGELFHAAVGDLEPTFLDSCKQLDRACCVEVTYKGDFAVISTGGHRTDTQLYQSTKALFNAVNIVEEGAPVLFIAGCAHGVGNDIFSAVLSEYKDNPEEIGKQLTAEFSMPAYVAFRVLDILKRFRVTLVSDMSEKNTRNLGFDFTNHPDRYIQSLSGKGYIIPFAENVLPVISVP